MSDMGDYIEAENIKESVSIMASIIIKFSYQEEKMEIEEEIKKMFDGLKTVKVADDAIKKIAVQKQVSWGDAVRDSFINSGFPFTLSQIGKIELRNTIETLEYIENVINEFGTK